MQGIHRYVRSAMIGSLAALSVSAPASATQTTVVVIESDVTRQAENTTPTDNWVIYTRSGTPATAAAFVDGPPNPPEGTGSLRLETATTTEKVTIFNYDHIGTALADVDEISYWTYRAAGSLQQVASLNLQVDYNGPDVAGGFTTLVFEPVYNTDQGPVVSGVWQDWVADGSGIWWSTQPINGQCAGAIVTCFRTWDQIVANNPDAVILGGVGINQGSGNPGLVTYVDAFTFDDTTYDFERIRDLDHDGIPDTPPPTNTNQCKRGGWASFNNPTFKNQGQCLKWVDDNVN